MEDSRCLKIIIVYRIYPINPRVESMIVKSILSPREHDKKYSSKGKFVIRLINI